MDVIKGLSAFVGDHLGLLAPIDQAWQPTDFLPDLRAEDWAKQVGSFRESAASLSDDLLVILVGNMVTEEALPNYAVSLNLVVKDTTGKSEDPWARWLRGWTAEENRHGDLLNAYLRLTGRVNMRSVEQTIHHLISQGFSAVRGGIAPDNAIEGYQGLIYAAFQERATRISHANVAKLANAQGDEALARICRRIAGDEARHETFYTKVIGRIMEVDPEGGVQAFRSLLRGVIAMPGRQMTDGRTPNLFDHFAAVSQRLGSYTVHDYARIIDHLTKTWRIADLPLSGKAARAQEYICQQAERYERYADEMAAILTNQHPVAFAWIRPDASSPVE